jgi:hypothetical protein
MDGSADGEILRGGQTTSWHLDPDGGPSVGDGRGQLGVRGTKEQQGVYVVRGVNDLAVNGQDDAVMFESVEQVSRELCHSVKPLSSYHAGIGWIAVQAPEARS